MKQFAHSLFNVFCVNLLATSGDITLSWTSPVYPKLYTNDTNINPLGRPITEGEDALIGSLLTLGAIVGPAVFGAVAENYGRKIGLLSIGLPHAISYITMAFANNIYLFYFGRLLGGLAVGGGYCLLPMYIAEVSKETDRGKLTQTLNIFWAIGNFIPYAIGPFLSIFWFNIILAIIPIIFYITFSIFGVETPLYYVKRNQIEKAQRSLMWLRSKSKEQIQDELLSIKNYIKLNKNGRFMDILTNKITRKYFIICVILVITQELSGFCAITFHLQLIFEAAGSNIGADISALIVGATIILSSFAAPILVDKIGRRPLTITSCFGMCTAHIFIGLFFYFHDLTSADTTSVRWVPIFSLILYIFAFNFGICSVPWTLVSEMFPSNIKEVASSAATSSCWVVSFIMTLSFNSMNNVLGRSGTFWFFATACLMCGTLVVLTLPETKGKSFLEIQEMLNYENNLNTNKDIESEVMLEQSKFKILTSNSIK